MIGACREDERWKDRMATIRSIQAVQRAETDYYRSSGHYASFHELKDAGVALPQDVVENSSRPYRYDVEPGKSGYTLHAWSGSSDGALVESFYSDGSGVIRYHLGPERASETSSRIDGDGSLR